MVRPEGFVVRKGILFVGVALLAVGIVVFAAAAFEVQQAAAAFMGCLNNFPNQPAFGFPAGCVEAMSAAATWQTVEALGGVLSLVGLVLLILGLMQQPERPAPAYVPYYPPTAYGPPQGPPTPPSQP